MAVHFSIRDQVIVVYGDTYRHRDAIKSIGGRFDKTFKTWLIPLSDSTLLQVQQLAGRLAPSQTTDSDSNSSESAADGGIIKTPAAAGPVRHGTTIRELVESVHSTIANAFPGPVWIIGEIENLAVRNQGIFLSLAEEKSGDSNLQSPQRNLGNTKAPDGGSLSVKATIWPSALDYLRRMHSEDTVRQIIQDGMQVRCLCRVSFYKDRAQLSLNIENIDPNFTKGALAIAREALLKELRAKGLDRKNQLLTMPDFPFRIGLISAPGSRAESDFLHQLESGGFPGTVLFADASTQGEKVRTEVPAAIRTLSMMHCDLIVITRGGGSASDLRWFDDRDVAYAIADCPTPVIAAIGHHDDTCIAEEICKHREKTPTAAAQTILNIFQNSSMRIEQASLGLKNIMDRIHENQMRWFDLLASQLQTAALRALSGMASELAALETRLAALDPSPWLARGWTQLSHDGLTLDSVFRVKPGMIVTARLKDGTVQMTVNETKENSAGNSRKKINATKPSASRLEQ